MPRLSAWFIRLSLAYLAAGFTLGALMLAARGFPVTARFAFVLPAHMEFLLAGWMMQLALGVAYWILPRFARGLPRGNEALGWACLYLLNSGILMAALAAFIPSAWLAVSGRSLEAVSIMVFSVVAWRRVRAYGE